VSKAKSFDLEVHLALVKLYQLYPDKLNIGSLVAALTNCLANFTMQGYALAMHMIPEKIQTNVSVQALTTLSDHLESAEYSEFWTASKKITKSPDFDSTVRLQILAILRRAYKRVEKKYLSSALALSGSELDGFLTSHAVKLEGDDAMFPEENTASTKAAGQDVLQFSQMTKILQTLN